MSIRTDLDAFIYGIASNPPDGNRLQILADWFEEYITPGDHLKRRMPRHFTRWWSRSGLSRLYRSRWRFGGPWSVSDIEFFFANELSYQACFSKDRPCIEFDHCGTVDIEGHEVYVSEPYGYKRQGAGEDRAIRECLATREALRCPVTYAREAFHHQGCIRFIIWHQFPIAVEAAPTAPR